MQNLIMKNVLYQKFYFSLSKLVAVGNLFFLYTFFNWVKSISTIICQTGNATPLTALIYVFDLQVVYNRI